jgi:hypothetical protein
MSKTGRSNNLLSVFCGLLLASLTGCFENDILEQPQILRDKTEASISVIEISDLNLFTYFTDSVITSRKSNFLLGNHTDPLRGEMSASPYLQFGINMAVQLQDDAQLDSVSLVLFYDYFHYDTLPEFGIQIYELTESPEPHDNGYLYGFDAFPHNQEFLVHKKIQAQPFRDSLTINIPQAWGEYMFELIRTDPISFYSTTALTEQFPGFVIKPEGEGPILSFTNDSYLAFHYKIPEHLDRTNSNFKFYMTEGLNTFTHLSSSQKSTIFENAISYENLSNEMTDGIVALDPLLKSGVRIEFPNILTIKELSEFYYISDASLHLPLAKGSYDNRFNYPAASLNVYVVDKNNRPVSGLGNFPITSFDGQFQENSFYKFSVKSFIGQLLELNADLGYALFITTEDTDQLNSNYIMFKTNSSSQKINLRII